MYDFERYSPDKHDEELSFFYLKIKKTIIEELKGFGITNYINFLKKGLAECEAGFIGRKEDGEIICVFAVQKYSKEVDAYPLWFVGSDYLPKHAKSFVIYTLLVLRELKGKYKNFYTAKMAEDKVGLRWLKYLGFKVISENVIESTGKKFYNLILNGGD